MTRFIVVRETTLPRLLLAAFTGPRPVVLAIDPILPPLQGLLRKIVGRLADGGRVRLIAEQFPAMAAVVRNPNLWSMQDIFAILEPWQDRRYRFAASQQDAEYGMAFRQVTCKYLQDRYDQLMFLKAAGQSALGQSSDGRDLQAAWAGTPPDGERFGTITERLLNPGIALAVLLASWLWVLRRVRLSVPVEQWFLAVDFLMDPRECKLYAEAAGGGPVLLVKRTPDHLPSKVPCGSLYPACEADDGRFTPKGAVEALVLAAVDVAGLLGRYGWTAPAHFYALATLPLKRLKIRALLNRHRPRFFWCRDEYNVDHILRSQEVRRVGGRTLGLMHGIQALADLNPRRRYIDLDVFYVFGTILVDRWYRTTWAPGMKVQPVGTFGFSREQLAKGPAKGSDVIAVFGGICLDDPEFAAMVRRLAEAFPGYRIQVKPKLKKDSPGLATFVKAVGDAPSIEIVETAASDLIGRARYVVSDPSTVVAEAVHLGVPAVMIDIVPGHRSCLYRAFPELCQPSAAAVVARLQALESGAARFDRAAHDGLVEVSGRHFLDFVRADLGLADSCCDRAASRL